MITKLQAFTSTPSVATLPLADPGSIETDPLQITNILGLDPVKATVNTTPYAAVDGENFDGSQVPSRNIVLTIHPNPDWSTWSPEALRQLIYSYFMPKSIVKLVFTSDELPLVEISGVVESIEANPFSQDPEFIISIICVDPYFTAVTEDVIPGTTILAGGSYDTVTNGGNIFVGFKLKLDYGGWTSPTFINISLGAPMYTDFKLNPHPVSYPTGNQFMMSSVPTKKYARVLDGSTGVFYYVVAGIQEPVIWPLLSPGDNSFAVITNVSGKDWELSFFKKYGGF